MGKRCWLIIANFRIPDSMHRLIISLYWGSNTCSGHETDGNALVHTNNGKYELSYSISGFHLRDGNRLQFWLPAYISESNSSMNFTVCFLLSAKLCENKNFTLRIYRQIVEELHSLSERNYDTRKISSPPQL